MMKRHPVQGKKSCPFFLKILVQIGSGSVKYFPASRWKSGNVFRLKRRGLNPLLPFFCRCWLRSCRPSRRTFDSCTKQKVLCASYGDWCCKYCAAASKARLSSSGPAQVRVFWFLWTVAQSSAKGRGMRRTGPW
jgi:hypothetical protein